MNELEITIKTNFKTTINLKKFFRNFTLIIFAVFFGATNFEKFGEVFAAKFQSEIQPKISAKISASNSPLVSTRR
jgi:hypothetical protein